MTSIGPTTDDSATDEGVPFGGTVRLIRGDSLDVLATFDDDSIDAVVTDPPYGLSKEPDAADVLRHWLAGDDYRHRGGGFMGKAWDSFVPGPKLWAEVLRVLKPGGHALVFAGSRTQDLMGLSLRLAGFEVRDTIMWMYGSGFPKSMDVARAIDKSAGSKGKRGAIKLGGERLMNQAPGGKRDGEGTWGNESGRDPYTYVADTDDAQAWQGWGTALKPAYEPIILVRKPLRVDGKKATVVKNVLEYGTGALHIDACRIGTTGGRTVHTRSAGKDRDRWEGNERTGEVTDNGGRFPANLILGHHEDCVEVGVKKIQGGSRADRGSESSGIPGSALAGSVDRSLNGQQSPGYADSDGTETVAAFDCHDDCPVRLLDEQTGELVSGTGAKAKASAKGTPSGESFGVHTWDEGHEMVSYSDKGGASRFFYQAKAAKKERSAGLPEGTKNDHPTVKPVALMAYLVRLITPPGGVVLDPYNGSGTTGVATVQEGFSYIGVDLDEDDHYLRDIARHRIHSVGAPLVEVEDLSHLSAIPLDAPDDEDVPDAATGSVESPDDVLDKGRHPTPEPAADLDPELDPELVPGPPGSESPVEVIEEAVEGTVEPLVPVPAIQNYDDW